jgi:hypothetical protein
MTVRKVSRAEGTMGGSIKTTDYSSPSLQRRKRKNYSTATNPGFGPYSRNLPSALKFSIRMGN